MNKNINDEGKNLYVHWLQFSGVKCSLKREEKQFDELIKYLKNYPSATAEGYFKTTGDVLATVVRLECNQNYKDLDLECNSMSEKSLKRLTHKPKDIEYSVYLTQKICGDAIQDKEAQPSILKQIEKNKSKITQPHSTEKHIKKETAIE